MLFSVFILDLWIECFRLFKISSCRLLLPKCLFCTSAIVVDFGIFGVNSDRCIKVLYRAFSVTKRSFSNTAIPIGIGIFRILLYRLSEVLNGGCI